MDLRKIADTYGGIPFFIILILYFSTHKKSYIEVLLLFSSIVALIIDVYLSFFYKQ